MRAHQGEIKVNAARFSPRAIVDRRSPRALASTAVLLRCAERRATRACTQPWLLRCSARVRRAIFARARDPRQPVFEWRPVL